MPKLRTSIVLSLSFLSACVTVPDAPPPTLPVATLVCPALPALPPLPPELDQDFVSRMAAFLDGRLEPSSTRTTPSGSLKKPGEPANYSLHTSGTAPRMKRLEPN